MTKRDPDDLISALSKNLKGQKSPVLRFTFKRGGLWQPQFAKAHSKKAKTLIKKKLVSENTQQQDKSYPLLVRYKQNKKDQKVQLNVLTKIENAQSFIESMLSVFRVNFFKQKEQLKQKIVKGISKANPESRTTAKKLIKKQRNTQRKQKIKKIRKQNKKLGKKSNSVKNQTQ